MVSNGPMKDQRRPRPSLTVVSMSSALAMPSLASRKASCSKAPCRRFRMKPSISFLTSTGFWPIAVITARAPSSASWLVQGAGHSSTTGIR
ncbi:hypothetical protein D3C71_2079800 [compost metagenome]